MSSARETLRYLRHIDLPAIGFDGQARIMAGHIALVGLGGLGAPAALYLAAAGVGKLTLIDDDTVDESNLQRQVLYRMDDIGLPKIECAIRHLAALNPNVEIETRTTRLNSENAHTLLQGAQLVLDCSDNFETRHALNACCLELRMPLITASVQGFAGQIARFAAHKGPSMACARCLFPEAPPEGMVPTCPEAGVFGPIVGIMGTMQAAEALKELTGLNDAATSTLLRFDSLNLQTSVFSIPKDPACPACAEKTGRNNTQPLKSAAS